jgi:parallel beta-helix repeat protein
MCKLPDKRLIWIMPTLLVIGLATLTFSVHEVKAFETIYILADGSISPQTASIHTDDNVTYLLTDTINGSITVEKANTIIDGGQHTLQGEGSGYGIDVTAVNNVTVRNITVTGFDYGIWFYLSSNSTITENVVTECNWNAITLHYSAGSQVSHNNITRCLDGMMIYTSFSNTLSNNNITNSHGGYAFQIDHYAHHNLIYENSDSNNSLFPGGGIYLAPYSYNNTFSSNNITGRIVIHNSPNNTFFHNSFATRWQVMSYPPGYMNIWRNTWDDGYPSGGNYWRDYNGTDTCNGLYQNDTGSDGIGDTPWTIDFGANNTDHYPLMGKFSQFTVSLPNEETTNITVISNSTITNFDGVRYWLSSPRGGLQAGQPYLQFNTNGENGSVGFCRLTIPRTALNSTAYVVLVDWYVTNATQLPVSSSTHVYLYFEYSQSSHEVIVTIPEFSPIIVPLFTITTLLAATFYRKKISIQLECGST